MAGDIGIEELIIVLPSNEPKAASAVRNRLDQEGSRIIHRYGARVLIAEASHNRTEQVRRAFGGVATVALDPAERTHTALDPVAAAGLAAFQLRQSPEYLDAKRRRPHDNVRWDAGGRLLPPDPPPEYRQLMMSPRNTATNGEGPVGTTSLQMTGSIAVGLIIVSGPTDDLKFTSKQVTKVIAEVQNGLGWHASQNRAANISWVYDIHTVTVDVQPNPDGDQEALWRDPAMVALGYPGTWEGVYDYIEAIKAQYGTDWTFAAYFTKYPTWWFAYASIGGPRLVMQYDNDDWGPDNIDRVFAHETGHIFQAPDEYPKSNCDCGGEWGIFYKPNENCQSCAPGGGVDCIMAMSTWAYCEWTPWHYGQALHQYKIGRNTTASTPFVTADGWVWFRGTDDTLWKVFMDGTQQSSPGDNKTKSPPFVQGDWVYFRGTDNALWRMRADGSFQTPIGTNTTASTPFVTPDGWVWFQGTDDTLWKVFMDGTQQSSPGDNKTKSPPFVQGDWVYFRGTNDALWRMKTDGSSQTTVGDNTTASTPFVTPDGWVWFRGTDDTLWVVFMDGTRQASPGNVKIKSSPIVDGEWVYFQAKNDELCRMKLDGSSKRAIGGNSTRSRPFVAGDWVYFRGMSNTLWACPVTA